MEKRVILAFALSIVVMWAFSLLYRPSQPPLPPPPDAQALPPAASSPAQTPVSDIHAEQVAVPLATTNEAAAEKPEEFVFETPFYIATISNVGGVLKSYKLKSYSDGEGHPLELINAMAGQQVGWPMTLFTGDKTIDDELQKAQFIGKADGDTLTLEFASHGLQAQKTFHFDRDAYDFSLQTDIWKDGAKLPHSVLWLGGFGDQSIPQDPAKKSAVYQVDTDYVLVYLAALKDPPEPYYGCGFLSFKKCPTSITTSRTGVQDQYFVAMFLSPNEPTVVNIRKQQYMGADGKAVPSFVLATTAPKTGPLRLYIGPKKRELLEQVDPQLAGLLNYGTFGFIARPLVFCLLWLHSYLGNFGWSIIVLTVALNLVLFPLRLKQQVSMLKMQKIQPKMRRLQDQYKKLKATDPRRAQVQSEMMNLYKEHGVNPMGGCLPLLLQMPLLFGFYSALAYSIELRRAPWIFWIKDLSQYDPYYVIPILMAIAMIIQQKLTPTANVDPAQAKMMMLMPLMMTFMFLFYSSGLALYWLTGSVIGIAQQVFINKYWSPQAEAKLNMRARSDEPRGA